MSEEEKQESATRPGGADKSRYLVSISHSNSGASANPVIAASEQPRDDAGHLYGFDRLAHVRLKAAGKSAFTIVRAGKGCQRDGGCFASFFRRQGAHAVDQIVAVFDRHANVRD